MSDTALWTGASGKQYRYYVFKLPFDFKDAFGGNYILCCLDATKKWRPIRIGQTGNFSADFDDGETADRRAATHVHAHLSASVCARLAEEDDLIENYAPAPPSSSGEAPIESGGAPPERLGAHRVGAHRASHSTASDSR